METEYKPIQLVKPFRTSKTKLNAAFFPQNNLNKNTCLTSPHLDFGSKTIKLKR